MAEPAADAGAEAGASRPSAPAGPAYEGVGRRFVASLIDNLTWLIGLTWLWSFIPPGVSTEVAGLIVLVMLSAWFNYFALSEWRWGQTIGKNAMGMRVISLDRTRLSFAQASVRNLLRLVDFFAIGWLMIATTERKQRLGDKAAKTVVLRTRRAARNYGPATVAVAGASPAGGESGPPPPPAPRGRLPAIGWDLSATMWGLLGGLVIGGVFAPLLVLPFDPDLDTDAGLLVAQGVFGATLVVFAVGVASRWRSIPLGESVRALGLRRVGWSGIGIGLLTLLAYYAAAIAFSAIVVQPDQEDIAGELGVDDPNLIVAISAVVLIAVVAPFAEELFFRGMVFGGLRTRLSLWPAAVISGLVFGLPHVFTGPVASITLAGLGVALAWLYERTGSLWPCILIHLINNSLALAVTA
jgi:uncharacterized protein